MTPHCDDFIPALVRAADDALPDAERVALDAHLATCAACAEALADQRAMRVALTALAAEPATSPVGARVMASLRAEHEAVGSSWADALDFRRWTWRLVPVVAALAIVVASVANPAAEATAETTAAVTDASTSGQPVSSALVTGDVAGTDLLSLLLNATADDTLTTTTTGGGL